MSASGVHVVINMGTDSDKNVVREHLESKYGKVEVIDLTVKDGKLVDKEGDEHARSILSRVDSHSKITISGQHSNLLGETFQWSPLEEKVCRLLNGHDTFRILYNFLERD